jgi:hypothetical protein
LTLASKHQDKADDYRGRAAIAAGLAEASVLARVREMHERAAASWTEMAELQDRAAQESDLRLAAVRNASPAKALNKSEGESVIRNIVVEPEARQ